MSSRVASAWDEPERVSEYVDRVAVLPQRLAGEAALLELVPAGVRRVLDLGCGDGRLSSLLLRERPTLTEVVAVDRSEPMLERARERFRDDERVSVLVEDLNDPVTGWGRFDLVMSGFAIHHLIDARKRALFAEIASVLTPGGLFANLEVVASPTPELHAAFRTAIGRRDDDPDDKLVPVQEQLDWMSSAGLTQVDCHWKWRGFALLVGQAPPAPAHSQSTRP